jgi:hypothetical protein
MKIFIDFEESDSHSDDLSNYFNHPNDRLMHGGWLCASDISLDQGGDDLIRSQFNDGTINLELINTYGRDGALEPQEDADLLIIFK